MISDARLRAYQETWEEISEKYAANKKDFDQDYFTKLDKHDLDKAHLFLISLEELSTAFETFYKTFTAPERNWDKMAEDLVDLKIRLEMSIVDKYEEGREDMRGSLSKFISIIYKFAEQK